MTIFFGANDAALLGRTSERQHVPVEEYKENLKKMVQHLKVQMLASILDITRLLEIILQFILTFIACFFLV